MHKNKIKKKKLKHVVLKIRNTENLKPSPIFRDEIHRQRNWNWNECYILSQYVSILCRPQPKRHISNLTNFKVMLFWITKEIPHRN